MAASAIHLSDALKMLDSGAPCDISVVSSKGAVLRMENVVGLRFDRYNGTRRVKFLRSGEIRQIRDVCIISINDFDVFL